jgi:hypothetical protein
MRYAQHEILCSCARATADTRDVVIRITPFVSDAEPRRRDEMESFYRDREGMQPYLGWPYRIFNMEPALRRLRRYWSVSKRKRVRIRSAPDDICGDKAGCLANPDSYSRLCTEDCCSNVKRQDLISSDHLTQAQGQRALEATLVTRGRTSRLFGKLVLQNGLHPEDLNYCASECPV